MIDDDWRPEGWDDDPWFRRRYVLHPALPCALAIAVVLAINWSSFGILRALNGLLLAFLGWVTGVLHERYSGR